MLQMNPAQEILKRRQEFVIKADTADTTCYFTRGFAVITVKTAS